MHLLLHKTVAWTKISGVSRMLLGSDTPGCRPWRQTNQYCHQTSGSRGAQWQREGAPKL